MTSFDFWFSSVQCTKQKKTLFFLFGNSDTITLRKYLCWVNIAFKTLINNYNNNYTSSLDQFKFISVDRMLARPRQRSLPQTKKRPPSGVSLLYAPAAVFNVIFNTILSMSASLLQIFMRHQYHAFCKYTRHLHIIWIFNIYGNIHAAFCI